MDDAGLAMLKQILTGRSIPVLPVQGTDGFNADFLKICSDLIEIRQELEKFAKGNLEEDITIRGAVAGCLKTLQANLRHLTWQVRQVAAGDFTQRVDFMGEFSEAFNSTVAQLDESIRKLHESEQLLRQQAMYDPLTELPNRILLRDRLEQYVAGSHRSGDSFLYAVLDLDFFKHVNDTYGHQAGDTVLKEFGKKISAALRQSDTAARIGGDEFVAVCACHKGEEQQTAQNVMQRLYHSLEEPVQLKEAQYRIGSSTGISFFPRHASDLQTLFAKADEALYRSKEKGRNTYTVWSS
ncbi:MAG: GGDEF domain-containing protein [Planctomycetaceae bacterium]|jgi:diguanylate cyclase (GGDEF)-like protein|nr:GGDEF domain-containing protein [Planctomycetaceae bacterium]